MGFFVVSPMVTPCKGPFDQPPHTGCAPLNRPNNKTHVAHGGVLAKTTLPFRLRSPKPSRAAASRRSRRDFEFAARQRVIGEGSPLNSTNQKRMPIFLPMATDHVRYIRKAHLVTGDEFPGTTTTKRCNMFHPQYEAW